MDLSPIQLHSSPHKHQPHPSPLTLVGFLQTFCEPKTWNSMTQLYMRVNVG